MKNNQQLNIFFAYSHEDGDLRHRLDKHLSSLKRSDFIQIWHDGRIDPGKEWEQNISDAFDKSDIILLLISADFIASDYCYNIEMTNAILRHESKSAIVIPIILKHCDWKHTPFSKIQALPKNALPIMDKGWDNEDQAFMDVTLGLRSIVMRILKERENNLTNYFQEISQLKDEKEKSKSELKFLRLRLQEVEELNINKIKLLESLNEKDSLIEKQENIISDLKTELNKYIKSGLKTSATKVLKARIINDGQIYTSINETNEEKWFNQNIKKKAGEIEWKKKGFYPKNEMIGEIVDSFIHSTQNCLLYVLKIHNEFYVPIGSEGVSIFK